MKQLTTRFTLLGKRVAEILLIRSDGTSGRMLFFLDDVSRYYGSGEILHYPLEEDTFTKEEVDALLKLAENYFAVNGSYYYRSFKAKVLTPEQRNKFVADAKTRLVKGVEKNEYHSLIAADAILVLLDPYGNKADRADIIEDVKAIAPFLIFGGAYQNLKELYLNPNYQKRYSFVMPYLFGLSRLTVKEAEAIASNDTFFTKFTTELKGLVSKSELRDVIVGVGKNIPYFNQANINEFFLRENHGTGISYLSLFHYLESHELAEDLHYVLSTSYYYRYCSELAERYIDFLSLISRKLGEEKVHELALIYAYGTYSARTYQYFLPMLSKQEKLEISQFAKWRVGQYTYRIKELSFPEISRENSIECYDYGQSFLSELLAFEVVRPEQISDIETIKRSIRSYLREHAYSSSAYSWEHSPLPYDTLVKAAIAIGDGTSFKILSDGTLKSLEDQPLFHACKAMVKSEFPKKMPEVKAYPLGRKGE